MTRRAHLFAGCALLCLALGHPASAAVFTLIDDDGANEGLNDNSARSPIGGNPGTTLGEQRRLAIEHAADIWAAILASAVPIRLATTFDKLDCNGSSATLGSAGPSAVVRDFPGAPLANTWYPQSLANALAGSDQLPAYDDIEMQFSSAIDTGCLPGLRWYYGFDSQPGADEIDFTTTVLHEIAHGLGFLTMVDENTGQRLGRFDDVFMKFLVDAHSGVAWPLLSDAQRAASAIATGELVWAGENVVAGSDFLTAGRHADGTVEMYAPDPPESGSSLSHFSTSLHPDELMEPFITEQPSMDLTVLALADIGWPLVAAIGDTPTPAANDTPTAAPNDTPTPANETPTIAPTTTPHAACVGDCDGDGAVAVDELVRAVAIALGNEPTSACASIDANGDGVVTIDELLAAVAHSMDGCV